MEKRTDSFMIVPFIIKPDDLPRFREKAYPLAEAP